MFRIPGTALGASVVLVAAAGAAMAQGVGRPADGALRPVAAGASAEVIKLSTVMKSKVLIQEDESAGQVVDVVLSDGGCIDYVVASYDDQYYAIPYSAVSLRSADRVIFVDIAPAQFRKVTFFAANQWPDFYARSFQQNVFATFDVDVIRHEHRTAKPNLDRRDDRREDRQDRRDDVRDNRDDRRDSRDNRTDARDNRTDARRDRNDGTAGEKGVDTPRDRVQDRNANPNERRDTKDAKDKAPKDKPDLGGLTPKAGDTKPQPQPKTEKPKADLPKAEKPKAEGPKPIAPSPSSPKPKDK